MNGVLIFALLLAGLFCFPLVASQGITINSPLPAEEGAVYSSTSWIYNISTENKSLFYYNNLVRPGNWIKICDGYALNCIKKIILKDGMNSLVIKAVDATGNLELKYLNVSVDSKKPSIISFVPGAALSFSSGNFSVKYTEANLENITLYYGLGEDIHELLGEDCASGINQQCIFEPDLTDFENKVINFWFVLSDKVNAVSSAHGKTKIDTTDPILSIQQITNNLKSTFLIDVTENNFKSIKYQDNNDCDAYNPKGLVCNSLTFGRCVFTKTFCRGIHNVVFTAEDKAGNVVTEIKDFSIGL